MLRAANAEHSELGVQVQDYLESGSLVPDVIMVQVVEQRLSQPDCVGGCLLDGFPRTIPQAQALDGFLNGRGTPLDAVIELRVDESELVRRLAGRGRADDRPEIIRHRLRTFYNKIKDLLDYYQDRGMLQTVDGIGTTEVVFERIKAALPKTEPH
jgi:adenylate kinase